MLFFSSTRVILLYFILLINPTAWSLEEEEILIGFTYTITTPNETLGCLSEKFYGHEKLWLLLKHVNLQFRNSNITSESFLTVNETLEIPPASFCTLAMDSSCLQILNYIKELNSNTQEFDNWIIANDSDSSRKLWEVPLELKISYKIIQVILTSVTISDIHKFWTSSYDPNQVTISKTLTVQIINDSPEELVNFRIRQLKGMVMGLPLSIPPNSTKSVYLSNTPKDTRENLIEGFLFFDIQSPGVDPFICAWQIAKDGSGKFNQFGIAGDRIDPSSFMTATSVASFMSSYGVDIYKGWKKVDFEVEYAADIFVKNKEPHLFTVRFYRHKTNFLKDAAYYNIIGAKNKQKLSMQTEVPNLEEVDNTVVASQRQAWLIQTIGKDYLTQDPIYIILNRQYGNALTGTQDNAVALPSLFDKSSNNIQLQWWRLESENLNDNEEWFSLSNKKLEGSICFADSKFSFCKNLFNSNTQTWEKSADRYIFSLSKSEIYTPLVLPYNTYRIRKYSSSYMVLDVHDDYIVKQYLNWEAPWQYWTFYPYLCKGSPAYFIQSHVGNNYYNLYAYSASVMWSNRETAAGSSQSPPAEWKLWFVEPDDKYSSMYYRIRNCYYENALLTSPFSHTNYEKYTLTTDPQNSATLHYLSTT